MTTAVFLGTSITAGGFPTAAGARLGWTVVNQGVGGSGYVRATSFRDRIATVAAAVPDVLVIEGGVNDVPEEGVSLVALTAELPLFFAALTAALPAVPVYVLAPSRQARTWSDIQAAATVIRAASTNYGHLYIDWLSPLWITGSGKSGSPAGDGNADVYVDADGVHPTQAGHDYLGTRLAFAIRPPATGLV